MEYEEERGAEKGYRKERRWKRNEGRKGRERKGVRKKLDWRAEEKGKRGRKWGAD